MKYVYNTIEEYVKRMYESIDIYLPQQLDTETIATRLGMILEFFPHESMVIDQMIIIDDRLSPEQQWQDFGHELCHALLHVGNQVCVPFPFKLYQEWKAANFAFHACVPTFMLLDMELPGEEMLAIYEIQRSFKVEQEFAQKRLQQYLANSNMYQSFK
ncbi:ImmA/IrrE family metallo-endopeptidase [Chungangia koreensis]|uniref:ImmA/IrrE family metallo-endopeptidase n=1 Tax=Chungangia koreensis TaxID=752657 RepID=A0ABV8X7U9_9LACT